MSALDIAAASLFVAGLTGPVFALILLVLFMTGSLDLGGLTPKFLGAPLASGQPVLPNFNVLNWTFHVAGAADGAKLCIWSFIAGFAEKLVPDVLDRFTKTSAKSKS